MGSRRGQGGTGGGRDGSRCGSWGLTQSCFGPALRCPCSHQPPRSPHLPTFLGPWSPPSPPLCSHPQPPWLSGPHPRPLELLSGRQRLPRVPAGPLTLAQGLQREWSQWACGPSAWSLGCILVCGRQCDSADATPIGPLPHSSSSIGPLCLLATGGVLTSFLPALPCSSCRTAQVSPPPGSPHGLFLTVSLMSLSVWLHQGAPGWS